MPESGNLTTSPLDNYLRDLDHPLKAEIEAVRAIILGADPKIEEGVKWNSPSFRFGEYFTTINTRQPHVLVILHRGAKRKEAPCRAIDDPDGLLEWLADDRAAVRFPDMENVQASRGAFEEIIRQWIDWLE